MDGEEGEGGEGKEDRGLWTVTLNFTHCKINNVKRVYRQHEPVVPLRRQYIKFCLCCYVAWLYLPRRYTATGRRSMLGYLRSVITGIPGSQKLVWRCIAKGWFPPIQDLSPQQEGSGKPLLVWRTQAKHHSPSVSSQGQRIPLPDLIPRTLSLHQDLVTNLLQSTSQTSQILWCLSRLASRTQASNTHFLFVLSFVRFHNKCWGSRIPTLNDVIGRKGVARKWMWWNIFTVLVCL